MMNYTDYSPETFGLPPQKNTPSAAGSNRTGLAALLGCGCLLGILLLCCCCCLVLGVVAFREPLTLASFWGGALQTEDGYELANFFTCENSQARDLTNQFARQGALFTSYTIGESVPDGGVRVTATLETGGDLKIWTATLFVSDGGTFGKCINRIDEDN